MEDFVEIDVEKIDALRSAYDETINSKSIYKMIGGKKMKSYKGYEIEKQKVDEIVEEHIEDVHQQYTNIETILSDIAFDGYEEGFNDGKESVIIAYERLLKYDKDDLFNIFFDSSSVRDKQNPIRSIISLIHPDDIISKLDTFDNECEEKDASTILKAIKSGKPGKIHDNKKDEYEVKLTPEINAVAERLNEYSSEELLKIFGYAGLPEHRFSQYIMDYSVNQINDKLDEYDFEIRMKAEQAKVSSETLEKFAKCIVEGGSKEDIERKLREIFLNN